MYRVDEASGLYAHKTLAPANAKYAKRLIMCGGKVSLDQFRIAKMTEMAVIGGQKILCARLGAL